MLEQMERGTRSDAHAARRRRGSKERFSDGHDAVAAKLASLQASAEEESRIVSAPLEHGLVMLTFVVFAVSTIVLAAFWKMAAPEDKSTFVTSMLTCAIAAGAYYAKVTGNGDLQMPSGQVVPLARYIDWITTTPLMLYELCRLGGADNSSTIMILGCDLICLSFGITSACLDRKSSSRHMLGYFFAAGFFYVFMMMALHDQVSQGSALLQPQWVQDLFYKLEVLTAVSWSCYPIVVFFGRASCQIISKEMEDFLLVLLDFISKVGMEALVLHAHINGHAQSASSSSSSSAAGSSADGSA